MHFIQIRIFEEDIDEGNTDREESRESERTSRETPDILKGAQWAIEASKSLRAEERLLS